jgi:hypothetical protein
VPDVSKTRRARTFFYESSRRGKGSGGGEGRERKRESARDRFETVRVMTRYDLSGQGCRAGGGEPS